jgi:DNA replication protein DnaD
MLYFTTNSSNTIEVTWSERQKSGTRYLLQLRSLSSNETTNILITKSNNQSVIKDRYDLFTITIPDLNEGTYSYIVYDCTSGIANATGVVETGIAYIQLQEANTKTYHSDINYKEYAN